MHVLVVGLGVIGTTYAYCFQKAGHSVEHLVRDNKRSDCPKTLEMELFDGRYDPKGKAKSDQYSASIAPANSNYDFIFISVSAGKLENVVHTLDEKNIRGTLVLFCGIWENRDTLDKVLNGREHILGYPVAGGNLEGQKINCVLFDHIMLESRQKAHISNYDSLLDLLGSADIKVECPYDMLEWIWLHMAINAGVISTISKYGDLNEAAASTEVAMNSPRILSDVVQVIRETVKIIAQKGVQLKNYKNDLLPYKIPAQIAGWVMVKMFQNNELTRRIMLLHSNIDDLLFVCISVYEFGKKNRVDAPMFYKNFEIMQKKVA